MAKRIRMVVLQVTFVLIGDPIGFLEGLPYERDGRYSLLTVNNGVLMKNDASNAVSLLPPSPYSF